MIKPLQHYSKAADEKKSDLFLTTLSDILGHDPARNDCRDLAELGLSLLEIGTVLGVSSERARQILYDQGRLDIVRRRAYDAVQDAARKEKKKLQKARKDIEGILLSQLRDLQWREAEKEGIGAQWALAYVEGRRARLPYPFSDVVTFFERYQVALDDKRYVPIRELVRGLSFSFGMVEEFLYPKRFFPGKRSHPAYTRLRDREKQGLDSLHDFSAFSRGDIAYFIGKTFVSVCEYYTPRGGRPGKVRYITQESPSHKKLTYSKASEIYGGRDSGLSIDDIAYALDTSVYIVQFALDHEREIASTITQGLSLLMGKEVSRPYLLQEDRIFLQEKL